MNGRKYSIRDIRSVAFTFTSQVLPSLEGESYREAIGVQNKYLADFVGQGYNAAPGDHVPAPSKQDVIRRYMKSVKVFFDEAGKPLPFNDAPDD